MSLSPSLAGDGTIGMCAHNLHPDTDEDREEALSTGGLDLILVPGLAFAKVHMHAALMACYACSLIVTGMKLLHL